MKLVYLVGMPGVGKTTVMAELLPRLSSTRRQLTTPIAHEVLLAEPETVVGAHLGIPRASFGGTDALAMNIQPRAAAWLVTHPYPLVLGEGDRLGNGSFFAVMAAADVDLQVVELVCDPAALEARRSGRGSHQDPTWLRGRATKLANLAGWVRWRVDATGPPAGTALELIEHLELPELEVTPP